MDFIDDKGRLLSTINIIDALAVLLVLAVVAAGAAFVLGADDQPTETNQQQTTVTFEITGIQPYVADAIPEGPVETENVAAVENKTTQPTEVVVRDEDGELHEQEHPRKQTVTLQLTLNTMTTDEDTLFAGDPLEVGRELTLDFGPVTAEGNVTSLAPEN